VLLAFDTATHWMSLALHDGRQVWYEATWRTPNNHTIELTPAIQRALAQNRVQPRDLTAVGVSQGPGSFTGLRIGLGVAKGLVVAQGLDLVLVPTLEIVALSVPQSPDPLIAVLQAGRGRICAQQFAWGTAGWRPADGAAIMSWDALLHTLDHPVTIAGEIDDDARALLAGSARPITVVPGAQGLRRAGFLAEIAWERVRAGQLDDPATAAPIYLHQPGVAHP
jgi:tRNA threonylcarbamoyladenosine biosynthesis protein TsaB